MRIKSLLVGVLVLVTATTACRSASSTAAPAAASPDTWATVDGKEITRTQVDKEFRRAGEEGGSDEETLAAKLSILDTLIIEEILVARATKANLQVPDTE